MQGTNLKIKKKILVQCLACKLEIHNVPVQISEVTCDRSSARDAGWRDVKEIYCD